MSARSDLRHRRPQSGYTLIEVLLAVAICAMVIVPLTAWVSLALRQQPLTRDGLVRTAQTGLLGAYLPDDIAVAGAAAVDGTTDVDVEDCRGDGAGGRVVLVLISGSPATKTVYVESSLSGEHAGMGVVRRRCNAETGQPTKSNLVFPGVVAGSTRATCSSEPDDTPCRQVQFSTTPVTGTSDVVLRGTRRTDNESLLLDSTGNRLPVAKIKVVSQSTGVPFTAQLTSEGSHDPDGTIAAYEWTLPPGATVTSGGAGAADVGIRFATTGDHYVQLSVTDDQGARTTTYRRITSSPRSPVAIASASPGLGTAAHTNFTFTGSASYDPDGSIASYRWQVDGEGVSRVETTPNFTMQMPEGVSGLVSVSLTVTDRQGLTDAAITSVTIYPPGVPIPDPNNPDPDPDDPGSTTTTVVPGAPTAVFSALQVVGTGTWGFDASGSTSPSAIVSYDWDFGLLAGTGTGQSLTHTYTGAGGYLVRLTVTNEAGQSASTTRQVHVPGVPVAPRPRQVGNQLVWAGVPGTPRYVVDVEYTNGACIGGVTGQNVPASASPSFALPPNTCPGGNARARVGSSANGVVMYSGWIGVNV